MNIHDYFPDLNSFAHSRLFDNIENPWDVVPRIHTYISEWFLHAEKEADDLNYQSMLTGATFHKLPDAKQPEYHNMIAIQYPTRVSKPVFLKPWKIFIGAGTILESSVIIKSPAIIGNNCQIRHTAYLRGNTIIGDNCVVGHATELKNSVFMNNTCAGHFAYVGDSVLGTHVNLGAGTKIANLQFRTRIEKNSGNIKSIVIKCAQQNYDTQLKKFGAVLGDHVETGCNSVLAPGAIIGKDSWIFPNVFVIKNIYPPNSKLK